jgi:cell division protein FtsZ
MEDYSILNDLVSMKSQPSRIMAMGVGGAGGNAIEHMWKMQIEGVNLAACNTDQDDLDKLHIAEENRVLLGEDGLGAGNNAEVGAERAMVSLDKVRDLLRARGTEMLFLAAGMGGGTGTGATPVIAELAHEMDILTVAIVTTPPSNDGPRRCAQATAGIEKLRKHVDAIIILSNDAINELYGDLPMEQSFERANDVVAFAAKGIAEIITHKSNLVNVDFADVCTVMRGSGSAIMGVATETGEDRAEKIVDKILTSPLFGNTSICGSRNVLINISVSRSDGLTLNEAHRVRDRVQHHAKYEDEDGNTVLTNIIWGMSIKPNLNEDEMEVVVVATGFHNEERVIIKYGPEDEVAEKVEPAHQEVDEKPMDRPREVEVAPTPKFRPAPAPIMRPSRNFAEIEECKRIPAYIKHNITLTTAVKAHQVGGVEKEQETPQPDMPQLF